MISRRAILQRAVALGLLPRRASADVLMLKHKAAGSASFTFVQGGTATQDFFGAGAVTLGVTLTGVVAGHLIVLWSKWEGAVTTDSASDGTTTMTQGTLATHGNTDLRGRFYYLLAANSGTRTYTQTLGTNRDFRRLVAFQYSYTGTASLDNQAIGTGSSSGVIQSGTATTTGSVAVGFGGYCEYSAANLSNHGIGGSNNANGTLTPGGTNNTTAWRRILAAPLTNGTAQVTLSSSGDWICNLLVIKAV